MGISNHERSPPQVIGHPSSTNDPKQPPQKQQPQDPQFLEMEQETCPWRQEQRQFPLKRSRANSTGDSSIEKHVSFATLHIREYSQVLGDHPCCTVGPPVCLGWDYTESPKVDVDAYEETRVRRPRESLRLTFEKRREIVSEVASDGDVRRVQRRLSRERCCSNKAMKRFFAASVSE